MTSTPPRFRSLLLAALFSTAPFLASAANYVVDFEGAGETKTGYASAAVTLGGLQWDLTEVVIGGLDSDFKNGERSARFRGYSTSAMTMLEDKSDGAGIISFSYRRYGTDDQIPWAVEISGDGGTSWTQVGGEFTAPASDDVRIFNEAVNSSGDVRIRIIAKGGATANRRLNIDDITITDHTGPDLTPPKIVSLSPAHGSAAARLDSGLTVTFNEAVQAGSGAVRLFQDGAEVQAFTVEAGHISGRSASFRPAAGLTPGAAYHVRIDAGAIEDLAGNAFPGVADDSVWAFTAVTPTPPEIQQLEPANNAVNIAVSANLMITFNEPVQAGPGSVRLYAGATLIEAFPAAENLLNSSTSVFFLPTEFLLTGTVYHVKIDADAFEDLEGTAFPGIADETTWRFSTEGGEDHEPPVPVSFTPEHESTEAPVATNLEIHFNEAIDFGADGYLRLFKTGNATPVALISVDEAGIDHATAIFTLPAPLAYETSYHVTVDAGIFTDFAGNAFEGISGGWSFTTEAPDTTPPALAAEDPVTPEHGAERVALDSVLTISFTEAVQAGAGNIVIKKVADGSVIAQIPAGGSQVSISSETVTIVPPAALPANTTVYVEVPAGAFKDLAGNPSPAYGGADVWAFTTIALPELTKEEPYDQDFAGFVSVETLPDGWTLSGPVLGYGGKFGVGTAGGVRGEGVLGYQHSSSTGTLVKTLTLLNATGGPVTSLTLSYTGRAATVGSQARDPLYTVAVNGVQAAELAYTTESGDNQVRRASVTGLAVAPGGLITITWTSDKDGKGSGASRQIGLTEVSVMAGAVTLPPVLEAAVAGAGAVTHNSAYVSAAVIADGGAPLSGWGFVFAETEENPLPEIGGGNVTQKALDTPAVGTLATMLEDLRPGTNYTVRAYAANAEGVGYSAAAAFTTLRAPLSFSGSYAQDFAGFASETDLADARPLLPNGWEADAGVLNFRGLFAKDSINSGGFRGNDMVLGYQHTGDSGVLGVTLRMVNDTGAVIERLWVSYLGRVGRATQTRIPAWTVAVNGAEIPGLAYSTASGVDGQCGVWVEGLSVSPGGVIVITWTSDRGSGSGASRQIGIADFFVGLEQPEDGYAGWAALHAGGGRPDEDYDGDGMPNGIEYFMNVTSPGFTANPGPVGGVVSWTNGGNLAPSAYGTAFRVETSSDLVNWTPVAADDPRLTNTAGTLGYSLAPMTGKCFVRLVVTP